MAGGADDKLGDELGDDDGELGAGEIDEDDGLADVDDAL